MQIPILNGIYTDNGPDLRTSYPVNMVPVPKNSGISSGFLRPGDGIVANGSPLAGIAIPLTLGMMILLLGSVSGAHLNPAVTLYFIAKKGIKTDEAILYILAQLAGGLVGAWLGGLYSGVSSLQLNLGEIKNGQFLSEVVATAGLVWIIGALVQNKQGHLIAPSVAAWLIAAGTFTTTGAVANPAVTLGLMFTGGTVQAVGANQGLFFVLAQVVGVLVALLGVTFVTGGGLKAAKGKKKK